MAAVKVNEYAFTAVSTLPHVDTAVFVEVTLKSTKPEHKARAVQENGYFVLFITKYTASCTRCQWRSGYGSITSIDDTPSLRSSASDSP